MSPYNIGTIKSILESENPAHQTYSLGRCEIQGPVQQTRNSLIYYAECTGLPTPAAIKVCRNPANTPKKNRSIASEQYYALMRVRERWKGSPEFRCLQPYALFPLHETLVIEWISGEQLTRLLSRLRASASSRSRLVHNAGKWLSIFHKAGILHKASMNLESHLKVIREMHEWAPCSHNTFLKSANILEECASQVSNIPVDWSWLHGDFKSDNIIVDSCGVTGVDISLGENNAVTYDIASFLNHLDLLCSDPRNPHLLLFRDGLMSRFFKGYSMNTENSVELSTLYWMRLYQLLCLWDTEISKHGTSAKKIITNWVFSGIANKCCHHLKLNLSHQNFTEP